MLDHKDRSTLLAQRVGEVPQDALGRVSDHFRCDLVGIPVLRSDHNGLLTDSTPPGVEFLILTLVLFRPSNVCFVHSYGPFAGFIHHSRQSLACPVLHVARTRVGDTQIPMQLHIGHTIRLGRLQEDPQTHSRGDNLLPCIMVPVLVEKHRQQSRHQYGIPLEFFTSSLLLFPHLGQARPSFHSTESNYV